MTDRALRWREDHEVECEAGHVVVPLSVKAGAVLMGTGRCPKCGAAVDLQNLRRRTIVYVDSADDED